MNSNQYDSGGASLPSLPFPPNLHSTHLPLNAYKIKSTLPASPPLNATCIFLHRTRDNPGPTFSQCGRAPGGRRFRSGCGGCRKGPLKSCQRGSGEARGSGPPLHALSGAGAALHSRGYACFKIMGVSMPGQHVAADHPYTPFPAQVRPCEVVALYHY